MSLMSTSNLTKETLIKMFSENKRFDGRKLTEFRDFEITYNISNKAEGSARIKLGKTDVVVGVKMAPGEPYPDSPDKGNLIVSGDLLPLASPRYESGPPDFPGIELPRLVDRAIRESGMIDMKSLVIEEGKKVWTVFIDIYPINDDGNVIDAACIAAVCALRNAHVPELDKEGNADYDKKPTKKFPLAKDINPISFSFFKVGDSIIIDPTREEEEAADARITFGASLLDEKLVLNSCQKIGETPLTQKEINSIMDTIEKEFEKINQKLKKYL